MKKLVRNTRDPEARLFWEQTVRTAEIVRQWPPWKRGVPMERPSEVVALIEGGPAGEGNAARSPMGQSRARQDVG